MCEHRGTAPSGTTDRLKGADLTYQNPDFNCHLVMCTLIETDKNDVIMDCPSRSSASLV